jgi:hypothetical protein
MADRLDELRAFATRARDVKHEIKDLEERLAALAKELREITEQQMPDLLVQSHLDHVGAPANGNLPAMDFKLEKNISANIAASWSEEKKQAAFAVLRDFDAEGLIKAHVSASLPKGQLAKAKKLAAQAEKLGADVTLKESVHYSSLSAWLRELYAGGGAMSTSQLEKIGGWVGLVVRPVERKD